MRILSGGRIRVEGYIAGAIALLGCILGDLLTGVVVIAQHQHYPIPAVALAVFTHADFAGDILSHTFDVMDVLFYGIAIYAGYRTALKPAATSTAPTAASAYEPPVREDPAT